MSHDLAVEGGTVITGQGRRQANVYVAAGKVTEVTTSRLRSARQIDASGLFVMPGMVDAHVHFMDPSETEREDFPTASAAAALAGVTTVIEHTHSSPVLRLADLEKKRNHLAGRSFVDFGLAVHALPGRLEELAGLWASGAAFIKAFTCTTHGIEGFDAGGLRRLFELTSKIGGRCLVHCEEQSLTADAERWLRDQGREDGAIIPEWRNREAEMVAIYTVSLLARSSRARVSIAHVSSRMALDVLAVDRDRSRLVAETCPQYLSLLESEVLEEGALRKFTPPARARSDSDLQKMWTAVADGDIDYVASDHAPSTIEQKTGQSLWEAPFGLPGVDTTMLILLDAAARGWISYERIVEIYSEVPSRFYGLHSKGRIVTGSDADLILVDPTAVVEIRDEQIKSRAGWSPYSGRRTRGRVVLTVARGEVIASEGSVSGRPEGRFLPGAGVGRPT